jgi:hypothetical protein
MRPTEKGKNKYSLLPVASNKRAFDYRLAFTKAQVARESPVKCLFIVELGAGKIIRKASIEEFDSSSISVKIRLPPILSSHENDTSASLCHFAI